MRENYRPEQQFMERALELARHAAVLGEVPVGAVVVHKPTGRIIGEGYNRRECDKSPLAHAEILAIEQASKTLGGWRVVDSALYVTLEPCPMCCGAILHARIDDLIFGATDPKGGAVCSVQKLFALPYNHKPRIVQGMLEDNCSQILRDFFQALRAEKRKKAGW